MSSSTRNRTCDVIVVGARCAGAATAMLLARAGLDVLVLEAGRAGSDTMSTHALMRGGVIQLNRWGLLDDVVATGAPAIHRTDFHYDGEPVESVEVRPGSGTPALYAPRRFVVDAVLADAAARAGADVHFGAQVLDVLRDDHGAVTGVRWRDRATGQLSSADAPLVIGADGRRSKVAELVGAPLRHRGTAAGGIVLGYFSGLDRHAYQWHYSRGATAGVIPTNDGLACVWAGMPGQRFASHTRPAALFAEFITRAATDLDLSASRQSGPLRGFPGAPGFVRVSSGPGWALVGDAGYFKDPLTAHGMTDALRDAELLARAVLSAPGTGRHTADALREYEATRDEVSAELRNLTERIASYTWDLDEIRDLLWQVSRAMQPEVRMLLALDGPAAASSAA